MKKIIVANWKANLLPKESLILAKKYSTLKSVKADIVVTHDQMRRSTKLMEAIFKSAETNSVILKNF